MKSRALALACAAAVASAPMATNAQTKTATSARGSGQRAAFRLAGVIDPVSGSPLADVLHLDAEAVYLLTSGASRPVSLSLRDTEGIRDVALSPGLDRLAYTVNREVSCDPSYSVRIPFTVVADTSGEEIAVLPGVCAVAWSPDGTWVAGVYSRAFLKGEGLGDSIAILELGQKEATTYRFRVQGVEWLDGNSLLLQKPDPMVLNLTAHKTKRALRRSGRTVSPDGVYSIRPAAVGQRPLIVENRTQLDLTERVEGLLEGGRLEPMWPPFWIRGGSSSHQLCVPLQASSGPPPESGFPRGAAVYVIDVESRKVLRKIPGAGIAPTPDAGAVVIYADGVFRLEGL